MTSSTRRPINVILGRGFKREEAGCVFPKNSLPLRNLPGSPTAPLSLVLNSGHESMVCSEGGREFQRKGAERQPLVPIEARQAPGTDRRMVEEDLRVRE